MNNNFSSYNDGIAHIYTEKDSKNSFGAKINVKSRDSLVKKGKSFYSEESRRVQDFEFAEGLNHQLTLKIKIPYNFKDLIKSSTKIVINNYLYDLIHFDPDIKKKEMYLYLEGVGEIE